MCGGAVRRLATLHHAWPKALLAHLLPVLLPLFGRHAHAGPVSLLSRSHTTSHAHAGPVSLLPRRHTTSHAHAGPVSLLPRRHTASHAPARTVALLPRHHAASHAPARSVALLPRRHTASHAPALATLRVLTCLLTTLQALLLLLGVALSHARPISLSAHLFSVLLTLFR